MRLAPGLTVLVIALTVALAACSGGSPSSDDIDARTVRAESFELTDSNGSVRAKIAMSDGSPELTLLDDANTGRFQVRIAEDGNPEINMLDENGVRRAGFEFARGAHPALYLRDVEGRLKAGMQVQADGVPLLFMRNSILADGFAVTLIDGDVPVLAMADPAGDNRMFLALERDSYSGSLVFIGESGEVKSVLP